MTYYAVECKANDCDYNVRKLGATYALLENAVRTALAISGCEDVVGYVDVIDAMTGEVMFTAEKGKETYRAF